MDTLLFLVATPLVLGLLAPFLPAFLRRLGGVGLLAYNFYLTLRLFIGPSGVWAVNGVVLLETTPLNRVMALFIGLLGLLIYIYSLKGLPREDEGKSLALILWTTGCALGVVFSAHLLPLLVFWGLSGLVLYFYALLGGAVGAEAAKKTFLMVGGADLFLLLGLAVLWRAGNSFRLADLRLGLTACWPRVAFFSLLLAALTKAGAFPVHTWVPAFSLHAPVEAAALLPASIDKILGVYLLFRVLNDFFVLTPPFRFVIMILGALTILVGVMMALVQHNGRKLLGYHAVSQVGYMVLGLGLGTPLGTAGGLFHLFNNTVYKTGLFLTLGAVEKKTGTADLARLGGRGRLMPWTFLAGLTCALAISGLPPLNGFVSKWLIYQSLVAETGHQAAAVQTIYLACLVAAIFGSGLTLASFLKFLYTLFFGKMAPGLAERAREASPAHRLVTGILAGLCLVMGIFAFPLVVEGLLRPVVNTPVPLEALVPGFYHPFTLVRLLPAGILLGGLFYLFCRRVRVDRNYVGGQEDRPEFTVEGTRFYDPVRRLSPLAGLYRLAEQNYFDLYHWAGSLTRRCETILQGIHTGLLPTYTGWVVGGFLLVLWWMTAHH
ncbi:MAG: proton-conducting transporter transmembrane domain-containing protein [Bacillota bacterium]